MRTHELKTWPEPFEATQRGDKLFEFRRDDRGFAVGDVLVLKKWDPHNRCWLTESNEVVFSLADKPAELRARVTYILRGFDVPPGFVAMGIRVEDKP